MRRSLTKFLHRNKDPDGKIDRSSGAVESYRQYEQQAPQQAPAGKPSSPDTQQIIIASNEIPYQDTSQQGPLNKAPPPTLKKLKVSQDLCSICQKFDLEKGGEIIHDGYKTMRDGCYICDWIRSLYGIDWIEVISIPHRGRIKLVPHSSTGPGYDYEVFHRLGTILHKQHD